MMEKELKIAIMAAIFLIVASIGVIFACIKSDENEAALYMQSCLQTGRSEPECKMKTLELQAQQDSGNTVYYHVGGR